MNLNSITSKISLIFFIAVCILVVLFLFSINYERKQKELNIVNYHEKISNYLKQERMPKHKVIEYVKTLSFKTSKNVFEILPKGKIIYTRRGFETIEYQGEYYFHVITPFFKVLFKDLTVYSQTKYSYIVFPILFFLLTFIYIWLIKSLKPLHELKVKIKEFSNGNLKVDCKSNKNDEIAEVSNEFDKAARKIELLLESRQLFLRTVMHELKTPIAKGRIVSELIDSTKQKDRMITIFERLDYLINDFSKIEQVVTQNYTLSKHATLISSILDDAYNVLMLNKDNKNILLDDYDDKSINVDLELMSMVFKNLIDNAIKYSSDKKVEIKINEKEILFISLGEKLEKELDEYFKPFHNDTKSKNHGMGLGLYIVKSILDLHGFNFVYEHKDGSNIFKIIFN